MFIAPTLPVGVSIVVECVFQPSRWRCVVVCVRLHKLMTVVTPPHFLFQPLPHSLALQALYEAQQ